MQNKNSVLISLCLLAGDGILFFALAALVATLLFVLMMSS